MIRHGKLENVLAVSCLSNVLHKRAAELHSFANLEHITKNLALALSGLKIFWLLYLHVFKLRMQYRQ